MVYRYIPILRSGASCRFPFLEVDIINSQNGKLKRVFALVDSGSELSIIRTDVATSLNIDLSLGKQVQFGGFGSDGISGVLISVDMQIWLDNTPHRWMADVIFSDAAKERQVLGQEGFFDQFEVVFRKRNDEFEIK